MKMQNFKTMKALEVKIPDIPKSFEAPHNSKFNFVYLRHDQARDCNCLDELQNSKFSAVEPKQDQSSICLFMSSEWS